VDGEGVHNMKVRRAQHEGDGDNVQGGTQQESERAT
jgi:hypothetical protein